MDMNALPPLRETLQKHDLMPKKSLGQNFLLDMNITEKIACQAGNLSGKHVLEIGPGPGGLTRAILSADVASLTVVEKDSRCLALLEELADFSQGRLRILNQDALDLDISKLDTKPDHIIANLPYNVASPLLVGWLKAVYGDPDIVSSMILMFQREVAERIYAPAGGKTFGRLAILSQWLCHASPCFELSPKAFTPPPKVTSTVVRLEPRKTPLFDAGFREVEAFAQGLFGQRRKMIRQTLKQVSDDVPALLARADIDGTRRAETLELAEFGRLLKAARG